MVTKIKVFGPPGCGKTTKLMDDKHGFQHLLSCGYSPYQITIITYRKSAANDLIERCMNLLVRIGQELNDMLVPYTQFVSGC